MNKQPESKKRNRTQMRTKVFECVYQFLINPDSEVSLEFDYEKETFGGVVQNIEKLKGIVAKFSVGFELERIYKVDLSILLLAVYELLYSGDVPSEVAIDQALELSKLYSTEKSTAFINGVLASVYKQKHQK